MISITFLDLPLSFRHQPFQTFPPYIILLPTFGNTFLQLYFYTDHPTIFLTHKLLLLPILQKYFFTQLWYTKIPLNLLLSHWSLLPTLRNNFSPPNFSTLRSNNADIILKQHYNSFASILSLELYHNIMPNYSSPRLSNITDKLQRTTHASRVDTSNVNNPTGSPTKTSHASYHPSNGADSPTYRNIVQNVSTKTSPFTSNTTMGLSDTTMPPPTDTIVLNHSPAPTTTPIRSSNNNNIIAVDDNHNTKVPPSSKPSNVTTLNINNYYRDLFDADDDDDFDDVMKTDTPYLSHDSIQLFLLPTITTNLLNVLLPTITILQTLSTTHSTTTRRSPPPIIPTTTIPIQQTMLQCRYRDMTFPTTLISILRTTVTTMTTITTVTTMTTITL